MALLHESIESPVGELLLTASGEGLTGVWFEEHRHGPRRAAGVLRSFANASPASEMPDTAREVPDTVRAAEVLALARVQLGEYFAGAREAFDIPLAPHGTPFQLRIWGELRRIPHGEAISYAELARRAGSPRAIRAVGGANARNPLSIVVPCHRVIGADGSLTGFGGGMDRKRWLLEHEGALAPGVVRLVMVSGHSPGRRAVP